MDIFRMGNRAENGYAVWGGVWERGSVSADVHFRLMGEDGGEIPVQSSVRAYWPDGSVKWSAHTADAVRMGRRAVLTAGEAGEGPAGAEPNETEPDGTVPDRGRTEVCVRLEKGAERKAFGFILDGRSLRYPCREMRSLKITGLTGCWPRSGRSLFCSWRNERKKRLRRERCI